MKLIKQVVLTALILTCGDFNVQAAGHHKVFEAAQEQPKAAAGKSKSEEAEGAVYVSVINKTSDELGIFAQYKNGRSQEKTYMGGVHPNESKIVSIARQDLPKKGTFKLRGERSLLPSATCPPFSIDKTEHTVRFEPTTFGIKCIKVN